MKWRLTGLAFVLPAGLWPKISGLLRVIFDPFIFSGFVFAFVASMFWMAAMTKFEITKAYPFMSLAPALVFLFGVGLLREEFTWGKIIGLVIIILGIIITVKL